MRHHQGRKKKGPQWPLSEGLGALTTETGFLCAGRGPEPPILGWGSKMKPPLWGGRLGTSSAHLTACLHSPELQVYSSRACGSRLEDASPPRTQCHQACASWQNFKFSIIGSESNS